MHPGLETVGCLRPALFFKIIYCRVFYELFHVYSRLSWFCVVYVLYKALIRLSGLRPDEARSGRVGLALKLGSCFHAYLSGAFRFLLFRADAVGLTC